MKKATLLIIATLLLSGVALHANLMAPATCKDSAGTAVGFVKQNADSIEVHLVGETIPTSGYIEVNFYDIAHFDNLQMDVVTSTGNGQADNCTANISYRITDQSSNYELGTATHTEGTPITSFDSNWIRYRINSGVAVPATITGNILITND